MRGKGIEYVDLTIFCADRFQAHARGWPNPHQNTVYCASGGMVPTALFFPPTKNENWRLVLTTFDTWIQSQFKVKMAANTLIPDYKVGKKNQFDN